MTGTIDETPYVEAIKFLLLRISDKHKQHGLSYRASTIENLQLRLREEIEELEAAYKIESIPNQIRAIKEESLDVAIMALLLFEETNRRTQKH